MATALSFNPDEIEKNFNEIIASAVADFNVFTAHVWSKPSPIEVELLTNFTEFFEYVIDVQKSGAEKPSTSASIPTGEPVAKQSRRK